MSDKPQISSKVDKLHKLTSKELGGKYRSKPELYHFVSHDCGIYVPHPDVVTMWHLRDLTSKKRTKIFGH